MESAKNPKDKSERTKQIPIQQDEQHFTLHIDAAKAPDEVVETASKSHTRHETRLVKELSFQPKKNLSVSIWNTLEWIATSALIFMVIFFVINFQAYYELFRSKLDILRGVVAENSFIQSMLPSASQQVTQELLPITQTPELTKKQIPTIALSIDPPDERVIIPRINKNVPVVDINPENLIKRDWNALEKDIQQALQDGVVHYPGTAQPGENGNIVITGHSSYFLWDPGGFKDVFALLHQVDVNDTVIVYYNQKKYFYQVYNKIIVMPDQVNVLTQGGEDRLTLITCTPVGTNLKRLVVMAKPIQQ